MPKQCECGNSMISFCGRGVWVYPGEEAGTPLPPGDTSKDIPQPKQPLLERQIGNEPRTSICGKAQRSGKEEREPC